MLYGVGDCLADGEVECFWCGNWCFLFSFWMCWSRFRGVSVFNFWMRFFEGL